LLQEVSQALCQFHELAEKSFICLIFGLILVFTPVSTARFAPPVQMFRHHALRRRRRRLRPLTTDGEALERGVL